MTAHILLLLITLLDPIVPTPKIPDRPTDAQIMAEGQKRANQFCSPSYVYPDGAVPFIVRCAQTVPDCADTVMPGHPYAMRCTGAI